MNFSNDIISLIEKMTFESPSSVKEKVNLSLVSKIKFSYYVKDFSFTERINRIYSTLKTERKISLEDVRFINQKIEFIMMNEIDVYTGNDDLTLEEYRKFLLDLSYNYVYNKLYVLYTMINIGENAPNNSTDQVDWLLFEESSEVYQAYLHEVYEKLTRHNYACVYPNVSSLNEAISYMENLSIVCKLCLGI
jgi:hypothetical protein